MVEVLKQDGSSLLSKHMDHQEQTVAFSNALHKLIKRYMAEFDLSRHAIVGVMEDKKLSMLLEYGVSFEDYELDELDDDADTSFDSDH